jgi:hypothetical protein
VIGERRRGEMRNANDLATRTVAVYFPDGETEYWLTDRALSVGDTIERNGRRFSVSVAAGSREAGEERRVTLQESPPAAVEREASSGPTPAA